MLLERGLDLRMTRSQIDRIVEYLTAVQKRPQMYFGETDPSRTELFLNGFDVALAILGEPTPGYDQLKAVYANRGFELNALGVVNDMTSKGLSREAIVNEIVSAHIDAWSEIKEAIADNN